MSLKDCFLISPWGICVDGDGILADLITANANNDSPLKGKFAGLHKAIVAFGDNPAEFDELARIINDHLTSAKAID